MNTSHKALLFSLFVFPGSGHFILKRNLTGALIVGVSVVAIGILIRHVIQLTMGIVDKIISGELDPASLTLTRLMELQSATGQTAVIQYAGYAVVACWLLSIIDIARLSRQSRSF